MPHVKLPETLEELERDLQHFVDLAESLPESEETRRGYCQVHAGSIAAKIKAMDSQQAFEELEQVRQEGLGI